MHLQSNFYVNVGNIRKAWLIVRRAVNLAQLLGLHARASDLHPSLASRRKAVWLELWQRDRGFPLLLGLPYATLESQLPAPGMEDQELHLETEKRFCLDLAIIAGYVTDRNQELDRLIYYISQNIFEELRKCRTLCRKIGGNSRYLILTCQRTSSAAVPVRKMRFYTVRRLVHLSLMLKASNDHTYEASRIAMLDFSREMIKVFRLLRDEERPVMKCGIWWTFRPLLPP